MQITYKHLAIAFSLLAILLIVLLAIFILRQKISSPLKNANLFPIDQQKSAVRVPQIIWMSDFRNNRVVGFNPDGQVIWSQNMSASPIPESSWYFIGGVERVTVAPNGNLITSYGDGMMVCEIDRATHRLLWQYGTAGLQSFRGGKLDEPHKAWKINDHEILINDSNDREVIVIDQNTNEVVWQYGEYHRIGNAPGILNGNTSVVPVNNASQFLITETLANRITLIDRASKEIIWQYTKPDAKWLENVTPTKDGNFILSDRLKGEVFMINHQGEILWLLDRLSDENGISYPTDTVALDNGHILIAEAGKGRIIEVIPESGEIIREYKIHGFVSTIAVDYNGLEKSSADIIGESKKSITGNKETIIVNDANTGMRSGKIITNSGQTVSGQVLKVNASTGNAGQINLKAKGGNYAVEVYNYTTLMGKNGASLSLKSIQEKDELTITGPITNYFISANRIQDNSQ